MGDSEERYVKFSSAFLILIFVAGLILGGIATYYIASTEINSLKSDVSNLKTEVSNLWGIRPTVKHQNITIYQNSTALAELYERVRSSVVLILGKTNKGETVQGSGFVYNYSGTMVIITNYHVIHDTTSRSVTFSNGNGYAAEITGRDPYADLAVLSVTAPQHEFEPLEVVNSSTLRVGDPVIAIGNPYGLIGSMTTGVVSALRRAITEEEYTGGYGIANIIQTSAPINPGNSGGPLLNLNGTVVGITTAIIEDSQGLGFAVPSNTIIREIWGLMKHGTYTGHSYLGLKGKNMDYEEAQKMGINVTYGWKVVGFLDPSPAKESSTPALLVNDIITAMNKTRIKNSDELASYLEEHTSPGNKVILQVKRKEGQELNTYNIQVVLDERPPPPV